jgi:hypothetical protein
VRCNKGWAFTAFCTDRCIPWFFGADFQFHPGTVIYVESTIEEPYFNIVASLMTNASSMQTVIGVYIRLP